MSVASPLTNLPLPIPSEFVYRFTAEQLRRLRTAGILPENGEVSCHDGLIVAGETPYRFSVAQYQQMISRGILSEDEAG